MRHVLVKGDSGPQDTRTRSQTWGLGDTISRSRSGQPQSQRPGGPSACVAGERACRHLDLRHPRSREGGARLTVSGQACDTLFQQPEEIGQGHTNAAPSQLPPLGWAQDSARQTPGPLRQGLARSVAPKGLGAKRLLAW